jgi:hypothetical protein
MVDESMSSIELRRAEEGRRAIACGALDGIIEKVPPAPFGARSGVHEAEGCPLPSRGDWQLLGRIPETDVPTASGNAALMLRASWLIE